VRKDFQVKEFHSKADKESPDCKDIQENLVSLSIVF
jgi:hypothetical protein